MLVACLFAWLARAACDTIPFLAEVQQYIRRHQHPTNCSAARWALVQHSAGIGSVISVNAGMLAWAINNRAVFVWGPTLWMGPPYCAQNTFECVFVAPTNCSRAMLRPELQVKSPPPRAALDTVPRIYANRSTAPFPVQYWWQAQAVEYLWHYNDKFAAEMVAHRQRVAPTLAVPCGSVCAYVRHGDKGSEMELLPWSRYWNAVRNAAELAVLGHLKGRCASARFSVFLLTDDDRVVQDARRDLGSRLLHVNGSQGDGRLHPGARKNSTFAEKMETFKIMMLGVELCIQCDAFVSQRRANFARLIDHLRSTRGNKLEAPFIEVGKYTFNLQ